MKNGMKIFMYMLFLMGILCILVNSCSKEEGNKTEVKVPTVTTDRISHATIDLAIATGTIISDGGDTITAKGVCWSVSPLPTLADNKNFYLPCDASSVIGGSLTNLNTNTTYYFRAFATNSAGTGYGDAMMIVTDSDGNLCNAMVLGTQVWLIENLKTTKYRNGDPIPNVDKYSSTQWINLTTGAYCYSGDPNGYGALYNWYAVNDSRKLAPTGWHVATDAEWTTLINSQGGGSTAAEKLKYGGELFFGQAGGLRTIGPVYFTGLAACDYWWSSTEENSLNAWSMSLSISPASLQRGSYDKKFGLSVRCVKD